MALLWTLFHIFDQDFLGAFLRMSVFLGNLFVTVVFVQKEPAKVLLENNWLASSKQL